MSEDSDSVADHEVDETMESQNTIPLLPTHKRQSFVWRFFSPVPDHSNVFRCTVCNETFANRTTNLSRHLQAVHGLAEVGKSYKIVFESYIVYIALLSKTASSTGCSQERSTESQFRLEFLHQAGWEACSVPHM